MHGVLKMLLDGSVLRDCYLQYPIENNVAYECNGLIVFMFLCFAYIGLAVTAHGFARLRQHLDKICFLTKWQLFVLCRHAALLSISPDVVSPHSQSLYLMFILKGRTLTMKDLLSQPFHELSRRFTHHILDNILHTHTFIHV